MKEASIEKLLHGAFKEEERQYLEKNATFMEEKRNTSDTTQGFECLVQVGSLLLQQREDLARLLQMRESESTKVRSTLVRRPPASEIKSARRSK